MKFSTIMCALFFLRAFNLCAMSLDADQEKWIKEARAAIENKAAAALAQAMMHITDQGVKKHLFRKIVREKPEDILLIEAVLGSGLELESHNDKETLVQFVQRKNNPRHITLIKKYWMIQELESKSTPMDKSKSASIETSQAKPIEVPKPKPAELVKHVSFKDVTSVGIVTRADDSQSSAGKLFFSKSGKISRRSFKNGNSLT